MKTALDFDKADLDEHEQLLVDRIGEHRWCGAYVTGEGEEPSYTYTTGFWRTFNFPEVVISYLSDEVTNEFFWAIFHALDSGVRYPVGEPVDGIAEGFSAVFLPVAKSNYAGLLARNNWFYLGDGYECLQLVWPDREGNFPWDEGLSQSYKEAQTDFTEGTWSGRTV